MPFTPKTWQNLPDTSTPLSAAGLNDLESRINNGAVQTGAGSAITTRNSRFALRDLPNIKDYGAKVDGTTDDTAAVQGMVTDLVATGGIGVFPAGTCRIATGISLNGANNVTLVGAGRSATTLLFDDVAQDGLQLNSPGSTSSSTLLTATLNEGDNTVAVTSAAALSVGMFVYIQGTAGATGSWSARIGGISGLTITLDDVSPLTLTVAQGATLYSYTDTIRKFTLADMELRCAGAATSRVYLAHFTHIEDLKVLRCNFRNLAGPSAAGLRVETARDVTVADCLFDQIVASNGTGQSLQFASVEAAIATNNRIWASSSGISLTNCPRSIVANNRLYGSQTVIGRGIRLLNGSHFSTISGNVITGFNPTNTGIYVLDTSHSTIVGNTIHRCGDGITLGQTSSTTPGSTHNVIEGNVLRQCRDDGTFISGRGIIVTSNPQNNPGWNQIKGNIIRGTDGNAMYIGSTDNIVEGNMIRDWQLTWGGTRLGIANNADQNHIKFNKFDNGGVGNAINNGNAAGGVTFGNTTNGEPVINSPTDKMRPAQSVQTVRVTTGSVPATGSASVVATFPTAYFDTNYTVAVSVIETTGILTAVVIAVANANVTVLVRNSSAGALTGTLQVTVTHD